MVRKLLSPSKPVEIGHADDCCNSQPYYYRPVDKVVIRSPIRYRMRLSGYTLKKVAVYRTERKKPHYDDCQSPTYQHFMLPYRTDQYRHPEQERGSVPGKYMRRNRENNAEK